ncbi:MAG: hypothetical protein WDW38_009895 [Sanguina aurantia]
MPQRLPPTPANAIAVGFVSAPPPSQQQQQQQQGCSSSTAEPLASPAPAAAQPQLTIRPVAHLDLDLDPQAGQLGPPPTSRQITCQPAQEPPPPRPTGRTGAGCCCAAEHIPQAPDPHQPVPTGRDGISGQQRRLRRLQRGRRDPEPPLRALHTAGRRRPQALDSSAEQQQEAGVDPVLEHSLHHSHSHVGVGMGRSGSDGASKLFADALSQVTSSRTSGCSLTHWVQQQQRVSPRGATAHCATSKGRLRSQQEVRGE